MVITSTLLITELTLSTLHMLDTQSRYPLFPLLIFTLASWMAVLASGVSGCLDLVTKWCTVHGCASWSACSGAAVCSFAAEHLDHQNRFSDLSLIHFFCEYPAVLAGY